MKKSVVAITLAAALAANGDTLYLASSGNATPAAFTNAAYWVDSATPTTPGEDGPLSPSVDYVVTNNSAYGTTLYTPGYQDGSPSLSFAGKSLTLDNSCGLFDYLAGRRMTIPALTLRQNSYVRFAGTSADKMTAEIDGDITVDTTTG